MRRVKDERGAVAVVVALVMVPLLAFAALSLDVAGMWWEKQKLQTAADAGALAIAQDCGWAAPGCGTFTATAQTLASANHPGGPVTATVPVKTTTSVTVRTAAPRNHHFAPALGLRDASDLTAQATVGWGAPSGGTAVLPLTFSWCEWSQQAGGVAGTSERVIYLTKSSNTSNCTGPSNNVVPGGFGWLKVNSGLCGTKTSIANIVDSDPGNSVPSGCPTSNFTTLLGTTVLLPLFDTATGTGTDAKYHIFGYAAFKLTGYHFGGQFSAGTSTCNGNERCVKGFFTRFVDLSEAFTYSATAPVLGASVISLTS